MAVDKMNEYAVQEKAAGADKMPKSSAADSAAYTKATGTGKLAGQNGQQTMEKTDPAVNYDVSERTNEVAAWYQELMRQEQGTVSGKEDKDEMAQEDEKDPTKEALEEAERILKSLQRMLERMRESQKKQREQKKKNKGKLSYNYRKVSTAISTAKTSLQASNALSSAAANLSLLKRKAASGQYEDREVEIALQHANKMVRAARKKVNNLKSEAQQKKRHTAIASQASQKEKTVHHAPQQQKIKAEIDRLKKELKAQEQQKKSRNRRSEDMELMQADMQYLRRKIDLMEKQGFTVSIGSQTNDDMLSAALGLATVDRKEDAIQAQENNEQAAAVEQTGTETAAVEAGSGFEALV